MLILFSIFKMTCSLGQSTPSASLLTIQTTEEHLVHHLGVLPSRGTQQGREFGREELHEAQQRRNNPKHRPRRGLESSLAEKEESVLVGKKSAMSQQCAFATKVANCILGCVRRVATSCHRSPLLLTGEAPHPECGALANQ